MSGKARLRRFDLGNKAVDSSVFDNSVLGAMGKLFVRWRVRL